MFIAEGEPDVLMCVAYITTDKHTVFKLKSFVFFVYWRDDLTEILTIAPCTLFHMLVTKL